MADPDKKGGVNSRQEVLRNLFGPKPAASSQGSSAEPATAGSDPDAGRTQQPNGSPAATTSHAASANTTPRPSAQKPAAAYFGQRAVRAEFCPRCNVPIIQPQIAIVCQSCNRFLVPFRFWHGVISVSLILFTTTLQASIGQSGIPVLIGLAASQLLLVFAVRPFERHLVLILISFLLTPISIGIVSFIVGFAPAFATFLQDSSAWIGIAAFLLLSVDLLLHWSRAGKQHRLSTLRIIGTFSIAISAGALALLFLFSLLPDAFIPENSRLRGLAQNAFRYRLVALLVWFAYIVILALPATFDRPIDTTNRPNCGPIRQAILHVVALISGVIVNLRHVLREGAQDIVLLCRTAIVPVARHLLFFVSVITWQVAFSLLAESYLSYLVNREIHALQVVPAVLLAATAPVAIFWTATSARLTEVIGAAGRTVILSGLLLTLCAAVATLLWWAFELLTDRGHDINWLGIASLAILGLVFLNAILSRERPSP